MKKKWGILPIIVSVMLMGCHMMDTEATFTGTIEEINGEQALVSIDEGDILLSGSEVMVDLSVADEKVFHAGDQIRVGYDGLVRESLPLGINTMFVEKVNEL